MKFKKWLQIYENSGRTNARPTQSFAANRSQLWGPSAQFGQPDSMTPIDKGIGALFTGVGSSLAKRLRMDISPQPSILGLEIEKEPKIMSIVLPLQYSEDVNMSPNSWSKPRTLMYKVMPVFDVKKINYKGERLPDKYLLPDLNNDDQTNKAVNFTKGLIFNLFKSKLHIYKNKFILDDPEVVMEDRKDMGSVSFLRIVVSYKPREISKNLDDKLSGQSAYQGDQIDRDFEGELLSRMYGQDDKSDQSDQSQKDSSGEAPGRDDSRTR